MKPTKSNATGVESYDHAALARLPEYQAARRALDALVKAIDREQVELGQGEWLASVEQMAASLSYADCCNACDCMAKPDGLHWPHRVRVEGGYLRGEYHCSHCGHTWTCGYAVNAALYI